MREFVISSYSFAVAQPHSFAVGSLFRFRLRRERNLRVSISCKMNEQDFCLGGEKWYGTIKLTSIQMWEKASESTSSGWMRK
jgi:hypothetical protein